MAHGAGWAPSLHWEDAAASGVALGLGLVLNKVAERVVPNAQDTIGGSPRWSWHLGQAYQLLVFPTLVFLAWLQHDLELRWLNSSWDHPEVAMFWERVFCWAAVGYFLKDLFSPLDTLLVVHHLVAAAATVMALMMPSGVGSFVATLAVFELGSCAYSIVSVWPTDRVWRFAIVAHSASNLVVVGLTYLYYWMPGEFDTHRLFMIIVSLSLIGVRQWVCVSDFRAHLASGSKARATAGAGGEAQAVARKAKAVKGE